MAIATPQRIAQLPGVPTFAEVGFKDFRFDAWAGLFVPARTPNEVVDMLASSLDRLVRTPEFEAQLVEAGMRSVTASSPDLFAKVIDEELTAYEKLARQARVGHANCRTRRFACLRYIPSGTARPGMAGGSHPPP